MKKSFQNNCSYLLVLNHTIKMYYCWRKSKDLIIADSSVIMTIASKRFCKRTDLSSQIRRFLLRIHMSHMQSCRTATDPTRTNAWNIFICSHHTEFQCSSLETSVNSFFSGDFQCWYNLAHLCFDSLYLWCLCVLMSSHPQVMGVLIN